MDLETAIKHAIDGNALLFLGAGYSCDATNLMGERMKIASEISKNLCDELGIPQNENLSIVSDIYLKKSLPKNLIKILKDNYTANKVEDHHRIISSVDWNRVYTTNYDNVFEKSSSEINKRYSPVTLKEDPRNYDKREVVIHINGYIHRLTPEKLNNEFKLTSTSYLVEDFKDSAWVGLFRSDVNNARAVFFVGTSFNYDIDLQRVLNSNPELKEKIVFIDREKKDDEIDFYENYNKKSFGEVYNIGTKGLGKKIEEVRKRYKPKSIKNDFECFTYLNNLNFKYRELNTQDIWKMLIYGDVDRELIYYYMEQKNYIFQRKVVDEIMHLMSEEDIKCMIIHSDLGNGKTCIIECLCNLLRRKGHVLILNNKKKFIGEEIEKIDKLNGNKYIVIENYNYYFDVLDILKNYIDETYKLILTTRSYIHESTIGNLLRIIDIEDRFIFDKQVNTLKHQDCVNLVHIINKVELWKDYKNYNNRSKVNLIKKKYRSQLSNVLLDLVESKKVKNEIDNLCNELTKSEKMKSLMIAIFINSIMNLELDLYDIIMILNLKGVNTEIKLNKSVSELINFYENKIVVKSPIIARYIIFNNILSEDVLNIMSKMIHNSNKFDYGQKSENVRKALVSCSNLWLMLNKKDDKIREKVLEYFDELKDYFGYRNNPFFWLQYAIACLDIKEYGRAYNYFQIAYQEVKDKQAVRNYHFDSFQINTQYARYLLEKEIFEGNCDKPFDIIKEAHRLLYGNFSSSKTLYHYIFKQVPLYLKFYEIYGEKLEVKEKNQYLRFCDEMIQKVDEYERRKKHNVERYVKMNKKLLKKCKHKILSSPAIIVKKSNDEVAADRDENS